MRPVIVILTTAIVFGPAAMAQSTGDQCARFDNDAKRLECYDLVFRKAKIDHSGVGKGKWQVSEDVSKFDDSRKVILTLKSEDMARDRIGRSAHSYLLIACRENTTSLWMTFADNFMSTTRGGGSVTYRLDDQPAREKKFTESNDSSALGLWSGNTSIPFVKSMLSANSLVVRATPFSESAVTVTYDLSGLETAIEPLRAACGW